jgi:hypothetical protein
MHPDLERLLSEDETARAGIASAQSRAGIQLEAVRADLARKRETRLRELQQDLNRTVQQILTDGDREVARRRAQRDAHARKEAERTATLVGRGADLWIRIVREGLPRGAR